MSEQTIMPDEAALDAHAVRRKDAYFVAAVRRLESNGSGIFVNVPDEHAVDVVDRQKGKIIGNGPTGHSGARFPMASGVTS